MLPTPATAQTSAKQVKGEPPIAIYIYFGFAVVGFLVYHTVAEREPSSVLTMSALAQCLGIAMLCAQSFTSGKAVGISAGSLMLEGAAIVLRLSSTLWLDGYLPADATGDSVYQFFDICSLMLIGFLLNQILIVQRETYQECDDTFPILPMFCACLVLGALLHGDMDEKPVFDSLWLTGLFTGVVAVLPQFWLITRSGGWAGAMTSHYIAAMAISRVLSGCFMWMGRDHITCTPYIASFQHTIVAVLLAHAVHMVLLADFAYLYARSMVKHGCCKAMPLSSLERAAPCAEAVGPISFSLDDEKVDDDETDAASEVDWFTAGPEAESLILAKLANVDSMDMNKGILI
jgi:hypothetical protein